MRTLSRRGFFSMLTGIGGVLAGHSLSDAAGTEATQTTVTPPPTNVPRADEVGLEVLEITGRVKWYDPAKGYGFIAQDDGGPDVLLHVVCLRAGGYQTAREGARVRCEALKRKLGMQAFRILHLDDTDALPLSAGGYTAVQAESGW